MDRPARQMIAEMRARFSSSMPVLAVAVISMTALSPMVVRAQQQPALVPTTGTLELSDFTVFGPYKQLGNPCTGSDSNTTFRTQNTCILPAPGRPPGHFIYMGDRWEPEALPDSRYIWLPFEMHESGTTLEWTDSWKP